MGEKMLLTIAVVVATALNPVAPAAAGQPAKRTALTLTYAAEAGYATAVKLRCDPAGGPHPTAAAACAELRQVGGRPERLRPARTMCMMIYAPITAEITGTWRGTKVSWSQTYGNTCEMSRATGVLFRF